MVRVAYCNSEYGGVDYLYIKEKKKNKKQFCGDVIGKKILHHLKFTMEV